MSWAENIERFVVGFFFPVSLLPLDFFVSAFLGEGFFAATESFTASFVALTSFDFFSGSDFFFGMAGML